MRTMIFDVSLPNTSHLPWIVLSNAWINYESYTILFPFYRWGNGDLSRLNTSPNVIQWVNSETALHPSKLSVDPLHLTTTSSTHSSPRPSSGLLNSTSDTHQEENNSCGHELAPLSQVLSRIWWAPWPILEKYPNSQLSFLQTLWMSKRLCPYSLNMIEKNYHQSFILFFFNKHLSYLLFFENVLGPGMQLSEQNRQIHCPLGTHSLV